MRLLVFDLVLCMYVCMISSDSHLRWMRAVLRTVLLYSGACLCIFVCHHLLCCMYVCMWVCGLGELTDVLLVLTTEGAVQAFSSNAQIAVGTEVPTSM